MKITHVSPFSYASPEIWVVIDTALFPFLGISKAAESKKAVETTKGRKKRIMGAASGEADTI